MGLNRKLKRRRLKEQSRQAKKILKNMAKRMNSLGSACSNCPRTFDPNNQKDKDDWMVYVINDQPNLICPDCFKLVQEAKKDFKEEGDVEVN